MQFALVVLVKDALDIISHGLPPRQASAYMSDDDGLNAPYIGIQRRCLIRHTHTYRVICLRQQLVDMSCHRWLTRGHELLTERRYNTHRVKGRVI